jgi:outer membrane protein
MLSQVSSDSAVWVSAMSDERISVLQLRALMNIDFETPFNIQAPDIDITQLSALSALPNAEVIFETATKNQYRMKYNALKLESAKRGLAFARSLQYPQLSLVANVGTSFSSANQTIVGQTYTGETVVGSIKIGSTDYPITQPNYHFDTQTKPLDLQYRDNLRANIGIAVSVPILNGLTTHNNIEKAKLGLLSQQITLDSDKLKLKQDIYKAYEEARASAQKYIAAKRSEEAAQRAMDFAGKRYNIGMISTFEYTSTLNTLFNASSSVLSAKYDLIFKLKVLDYYMGNPIKL